MLGELRTRGNADALRRAVGRAKVGMRLFKLNQLAKQPVVVGVSDLGLFENVIEVVVPLEFGSQPRGALSRVHGKRYSWTPEFSMTRRVRKIGASKRRARAMASDGRESISMSVSSSARLRKSFA